MKKTAKLHVSKYINIKIILFSSFIIWGLINSKQYLLNYITHQFYPSTSINNIPNWNNTYALQEKQFHIDRNNAIFAIENYINQANKNKVYSPVVIYGKAGTGKSELIREFHSKYLNAIGSDQDTLIKYFDCADENNLLVQLRSFAEEIGTYTVDSSDNELTGIIVNKTKNKKQILYIFDNLNNSESIKVIDNLISKQNNYNKLYNVIITTNNKELISKLEEAIKINLLDMESIEIKLNDFQSLQFIEKFLGNNKNNKTINQHLALLLNYNPEAIKRVCSYIKYNKNTVEDYIRLLNEEIEKNYNSNQYNISQELYVVNNITLKSIINDPIIFKFLVFISFLNTNSLQPELLELWLHENKIADSKKILDLLSQLFILDRQGDSYIFSTSIQHNLINLYSDNKAEFNNVFKELILFVRNNFKRNNISPYARIKNSLFVKHISFINNHYNKIYNNDNQISSDQSYFNVSMACYFMMEKRHSIKAREILLFNKNEIEKKLLLSRLKDNIELNESDFALLVTYVQTLYHLGRTSFDLGDYESNIYFDNFKQAVKYRDVIEKQLKQNPKLKQIDLLYNESNLDSILIMSGGLLEYQLYTSYQEKDLLDIISKYKQLLHLFPENKLHVFACKSHIFRARQKIASVAKTKSLRNSICNEALKEMYGAIGLNFDDCSDKIYKEILTYLKEDKNFSNKRKYINDLGAIFLLKEEPEISIKIFLRALLVENLFDKQDIHLANTYLGLAKAYSNKDVTIALSYLKKCQEILVKNHTSVNHISAKEAAILNNKLLQSFI